MTDSSNFRQRVFYAEDSDAEEAGQLTLKPWLPSTATATATAASTAPTTRTSNTLSYRRPTCRQGTVALLLALLVPLLLVAVYDARQHHAQQQSLANTAFPPTLYCPEFIQF